MSSPSSSTSFVPGLYVHCKGRFYRAWEVVRHSETAEPLVLYQTLYGDRGWWVRPLAMFVEQVQWQNRQVPRFALLQAEEPDRDAPVCSAPHSEHASGIALVTTTLGSVQEAERWADLLVRHQLAACVQITPIRSVYRWQGTVERAPEWLLGCKTPDAWAPLVAALLQALHPYALPEIRVTRSEPVSPAYAAWVQDSTRDPRCPEELLLRLHDRADRTDLQAGMVASTSSAAM